MLDRAHGRDLHSEAPSDYKTPTPIGILECRHDGEAPITQALVPVDNPEFPIEVQPVRIPRILFEQDFIAGPRLARLAEEAHGPFVLESYGLYDGPVGARTFPLNDLAMHTIRSAVHTIWIDYTTIFDTSIWLVWPQPPTTPPPVRVFVIAQFVDFLLRIPNDWQPVLVDQQALSPGGVGVTTIRAAAYLPTPSRIEAVYDAARLSISCLPRGLRPCWVVWRFQEWQYPSVLQPVAGDYLVVKVGNLQQYFTNTHTFFPNVRRFALDSQRILSRYAPGVSFPTWVHAIGHHFEPLGWRMIQIHIEDLIQPERLWNMAQWVWRDKLPGRNAVLHPALPQPSLGHRGRDRLHLIFAFVPKPGHQPTLYVGLQFVDASRYQFGQELQWNAVYTPQLADDKGLLRASTLEHYARVTGAEYEITYNGHKVQSDVQLPVLTGAFYIVNLYAPTWIGLLESLWIEVQRNIVLQHDDTSLLQVRMTIGRTPTSSRRQSLDIFERLSPPGNGPIVDLRHDLDKLDDVQFFPWGQCCFDFDCLETMATIRQVNFELPDLQPLVDQICGAPLPTMPIDFIHNHTDELPVDCWDWVDALSPTPPANFVVRQIYTDGSYDGYTEGMPTIGWGYVIFLCGPNSIYVEHIACGHIVDDMTPMVHGIPIAMGARTGEIEALLQAHLWLCAAGSTVPVEVYFDAITVGFSGFGKWNFNPGDQHLRILRSLSQFLDTLPHPPEGHHVKAHTGVFGNEIANLLAQHARLKFDSFGVLDVDLSPYTVGDRMPIESLWIFGVMDDFGGSHWPSRQGNQVTCPNSTTTPTISSSLPTTIWDDTQWQQKLRSCEVGFATYNVGTLAERHDRHERLGAHEYLREQCISHGITVLFLQETRARHSAVVESGSHVRLVSQCHDGNGGTEIWIAKCNAQGKSNGTTSKDFLVLHTHHELLIVRWRAPHGDYLLVSAHAPHTGRSHADITSWWTQLAGLLRQYHCTGHESLIIGIDANAHLSEDSDPWVGSLGLEPTTNFGGTLFLDFLCHFDLFLPSTYQDMHEGATATWRVGRACATTRECRCDYMCIPLSWKQAQIHSIALPELDAGMSSVDHTAVGVWCKFMAKTKQRPRPRIDPVKIPEALETHSSTLFEGLSNISWTTDAHTHANMISSQVSDWLHKHCSAKKSGPRSSYITDTTWTLREQRLQLQHRMRSLRDLMTSHQIHMALTAWRTQQPLAHVRDENLHKTFLQLRTHRLILQALRISRGRVRKALRFDRTQYLERLGQEVMDTDPRYTYKILRNAGVRGKAKKSSIQPLPFLKNASGEVVSTFGEWSEVWRQQFEQQEGGKLCTGEELLRSCLAQQRWSLQHDALPDWFQIPTLTELEGVLRRAATGKAFFEDLVPGELLHFGAAPLAKVLYPLLLKQLALKQEPILFKGGLLVSAYKRGDPSVTANYRSLLISPTIGKAFHRLLRADLMVHFDRQALPLQLGGRPGISVTQAAHALQSFLCYQRDDGRSVAVIFLDIRNAFYQLFREQLVRSVEEGHTLRTLFDTLHLPDAAFVEFCSLMSHGTAMDDCGAPLYLHTQVQELLNTTWFIVPGSSRLTKARKGSRPGDSAADLLFSVAFAIPCTTAG